MWHEKEIKDGSYPYAGGWVSQPLDLLVKFQAMSLMYSYKMTMNQKKVSKESMQNLTKLQHQLADWAESE